MCLVLYKFERILSFAIGMFRLWDFIFMNQGCGMALFADISVLHRLGHVFCSAVSPMRLSSALTKLKYALATYEHTPFTSRRIGDGKFD